MKQTPQKTIQKLSPTKKGGMSDAAKFTIEFYKKYGEAMSKLTNE